MWPTPAAMYDDGRRELPMGEQPEGFIRYTADGDVVCHIARAGRAKFVKGGQWNAPDDEKAAAYPSMLAYSGRCAWTATSLLTTFR